MFAIDPVARMRVIAILVFGLVIYGGALLFIALPKQQMSADEKRELAHWPAFSWDAYLSGRYTDGIDSYYSDNFVFRSSFVDAAGAIRQARGRAYGGIQLFEDPVPAASAAAPSDAASAGTTEAEPAFQTVRSVVIFRGRAVQRFGGSNPMVEPVARAINRFTADMGGRVRVFAMAIPVGSDFYLPSAMTGGEMKDRDNIVHFYSQLDPQVLRVPAYGELARHTSDYILFNTDHHWTARGAYHAYRAFAGAAGFRPIDLDAMKRGRIRNFLGTLYYRTRSPELRANPDRVDYWKVPYRTRSTVFRRGYEEGVPGSLYYTRASGGNAYGVFLAGDSPLMRVVADNGSRRKILITKDSYGNAFAPFLAANYGEVYIVDYRYFRGDIREVIDHYGIHDVLFAHNTYVLNTPSAAESIAGLLGQ